MRCHIIEIATTSHIGLKAPCQGLPILDSLDISSAHGFGITYLNIQNLTDLPTLHDILHLLEIWEISAIISHETWDTRLLRNAVNTGTVIIAGS